MPIRALLLVSALLVGACVGGTGSGAQGPPSARSVAENSSDFSGVQRCPQTGSYDRYLLAERSKEPDKYASDKNSWDSLKAAGADDSYISANADSSFNCDQFGSSTFQGKVAEVFAVRFKDSATAAAAFTTSEGQFHLADPEVAQLKGYGATVLDGTSTGLGSNSIVVKFDLLGAAAYIALWQGEEFEVAMLTYNLGPTAGPAAATKVNSRIH